MLSIVGGVAGLLLSFWLIKLTAPAELKLTFDPGRLVTVTINPEHRQYKDGEAVSRYADRALRALREIPGVEKAAISSSSVTTGWSAYHQVTFRDKTLNGPEGARVIISYVSPEFCSMLGQNLRQGRPFSPGAEARNQALVNEDFVRVFFPDRDTIGEEVLIYSNGAKQTWVAITGVVADRNKRLVLRENYPEIYVSSELPFVMSHQIAVQPEPVFSDLEPPQGICDSRNDASGAGDREGKIEKIKFLQEFDQAPNAKKQAKQSSEQVIAACGIGPGIRQDGACGSSVAQAADQAGEESESERENKESDDLLHGRPF